MLSMFIRFRNSARHSHWSSGGCRGRVPDRPEPRSRSRVYDGYLAYATHPGLHLRCDSGDRCDILHDSGGHQTPCCIN